MATKPRPFPPATGTARARLAAVSGRTVTFVHLVPEKGEPDDAAGAFSPRDAVVAPCGFLLAGVGVLAALSTFLWSQHEGVQVEQASAAIVLGLVLAGCAVGAPRIPVRQAAFAGPPAARRAGTPQDPEETLIPPDQ